MKVQTEISAVPAENRAYMDGYIKGAQATGRDWALARVALIELEEKVKAELERKDGEILKLKGQLRRQRDDYEARIIDLESHIEALKLAWKHRGDE